MTVLSIIVPVKDEEDSIAPFIARVIPVLRTVDDAASRSFEILFVDDGSTDSTIAQIQHVHQSHPNVRAISLSRNFGKEIALSAGLDHARGEAVVPIDVDLQDPPEAIGDMLAKWRVGFYIV